MSEIKNEYKVSMTRNFGTEQLAFAATIHATPETAEAELQKAVDQYQNIIKQAFQTTVVRHDAENDFVTSRMTPEQLKQIEKMRYLPKGKK